MSEQKVGAVFGAMAKASRMLAQVGIDKSSENAAQGFSFRGIDAVLGAMSKVLVECGLVVIPTVKDHGLQVITDPKSGKLKFQAKVMVDYYVCSTVDGSQLVACFCAESLDSQDKATSKALSMAYKYFAFQTFCIPLEGVLDDADADSPMQEQEEAPAKKPAAKKAAAKQEETPAPVTQSESDEAAELVKSLAALKAGEADMLAQLRGRLLGYRGTAVFAELKTAYKAAQAVVETK